MSEKKEKGLQVNVFKWLRYFGKDGRRLCFFYLTVGNNMFSYKQWFLRRKLIIIINNNLIFILRKIHVNMIKCVFSYPKYKDVCRFLPCSKAPSSRFRKRSRRGDKFWIDYVKCTTRTMRYSSKRQSHHYNRSHGNLGRGLVEPACMLWNTTSWNKKNDSGVCTKKLQILPISQTENIAHHTHHGKWSSVVCSTIKPNLHKEQKQPMSAN